MTKYRVKFEMYGKFLSTEVVADSRPEAMEVVRRRIKFIEVKEVPIEPKSIFDLFDDIGIKL